MRYVKPWTKHIASSYCSALCDFYQDVNFLTTVEIKMKIATAVFFACSAKLVELRKLGFMQYQHSFLVQKKM